MIMNKLENNIKGVIDNKIHEGVIEKLISENFEDCIKKSLDNLFSSYGDITKLVQGKIKSVLVQHLEAYDYSEYIVKIDKVLTEIIKNTSIDNKKLLENFSELMTNKDIPKKITISEIFDKYKDYVSKNIDTSNLDLYDNGDISYEDVEVTYDTIEETSRPWSSIKHMTVFFECKKDTDMNIEFKLSRWDEKEYWELDTEKILNLNSLRYLSKFKIFLIQLCQNYTKIEIDEPEGYDEIEVEAEPEPIIHYS